MPTTALVFFFFDAGASGTAHARVTQELLEVAYSGGVAARVTQELLEVAYLTETVYGFDECGVYQGPREWELRLYDANRKRKSLVSVGGAVECDLGEVVSSCSFELMQRGGFGSGSFEYLAPFDRANLDGTESVDIYLWGAIAYRGYVKVAQAEVSAQERVTATLYGLVGVLDGYQIRRKYAYGCNTDIATIFADIIRDHVQTAGRFPALTVFAETTGIEIKEFDARGKSVAQAFNALCDLSPGEYDWGADVTTAGGDRLYLRVRPTTTGYVFAIGDNVEAFVYPRDTQQIVNRLFITGGNADQGNVCPNASFEDSAPQSETVANLIPDYSFEDDGAGWTLNGGATVKYIGHPTAHGSPRTGSKWLEIDTAGENGEFTVPVIAGGKYTASFWGRREDPAIPNTVRLEFEGLTSGGAVVVTATDGYRDPGSSGVYKKYEATLDFASYPTVAKARLRAIVSGGSASNDGIIVDDAAIIQYCAEGQTSWVTSQVGNGALVDIDWSNRDVTPFHGGSCLKIQTTGIASGSDYVEARTARIARFSVSPNERYTLLCYWQTNGAGAAYFTLGVEQFKSDNTSNGVTVGGLNGGNVSAWTQSGTVEINILTDTTTVEVILRCGNVLDGGVPLYLDAVLLVKGEMSDDVLSNAEYWAGAAYEKAIDVTDSAIAASLDSGVVDSITNYDEHEATISNANVIDRASAIALAVGVFNNRALPKVQARLQITAPRQRVALDGLVKIVNLTGAPDPLLPVRVGYQMDEAIRQDIQLGNERDELAGLLRIAQGRET